MIVSLQTPALQGKTFFIKSGETWNLDFIQYLTLENPVYF